MDFTFDLSQTPVIGRRWLIRQGVEEKSLSSPRCSLSLSPADSNAVSGWKRPWMSQVWQIILNNIKFTNMIFNKIYIFQGRVRECLVNLLTTCGQRVGLPKSPSVSLYWRETVFKILSVLHIFHSNSFQPNIISFN